MDVFGTQKDLITVVNNLDDLKGVVVVDQTATMTDFTGAPAERIEKIARVCHRSQDKMICTHRNPDPNSVDVFGNLIHAQECPECMERRRKFLQSTAGRGHHSVFEHAVATFKIVTGRGITHELVRHRLASYTQESTRYVKMFEQMPVVMPHNIQNNPKAFEIWKKQMEYAHDSYKRLIEAGLGQEIARDVLPTCLATVIYMTANAREWRESFIKLRAEKSAHPQMRALARQIYDGLLKWFPEYFDACEVCPD